MAIRYFSIFQLAALLMLISCGKYVDDAMPGGPSSPKAAFSPAQLSGLKLWFKADAIVPQGDYSNLAIWPDSSPSAGNAIQMSFSAQPLFVAHGLNDLPFVTFGGSQSMNTSVKPVSGATSRSVFAVIAHGNLTGSQYEHIVHFGSTSINAAYGLTFCTSPGQTGGGSLMGNHYWGVGFSSAQAPTFKPIIIATSYNGIYDEFYSNGQSKGTQVVSLNTGTALPVMIGARLDGNTEFFQGEVYEILIFSPAVSPENRKQVFDYLNSKYLIY